MHILTDTPSHACFQELLVQANLQNCSASLAFDQWCPSIAGGKQVQDHSRKVLETIAWRGCWFQSLHIARWKSKDSFLDPLWLGVALVWRVFDSVWFWSLEPERWYATCYQTKDFIRPSESAQERESQQKLGSGAQLYVQWQPKQNWTWNQKYVVDSVYSRVAPLLFFTPMGHPFKFSKLIHIFFIFCSIAWNDVALTFKLLQEECDDICTSHVSDNQYTAVICRNTALLTLRIFEVWKSNKKPSKVRNSGTRSYDPAFKVWAGHATFPYRKICDLLHRTSPFVPSTDLRKKNSEPSLLGRYKHVNIIKHHTFLENFPQRILLHRVGTHFLAIRGMFQAALEEKATDIYAEGMQHYRHRRFSEVPWPRGDQQRLGSMKSYIKPMEKSIQTSPF